MNPRIFILFVCFIFSACSPSEGTRVNDIEIVSGEIGGQTYYVPKKYLKLKEQSISNDTIYVQMMFPYFYPLLLSEQEYWKRGQRFRNIRILGKHYENPAGVVKLLKTMIETKHAFEVVGDEYGLTHRTQPDGYVKDHKDIWVEEVEGDVVSYIACSDKLSKTSVPQCQLHFFLDTFHIKTSFDKRLLPDWRAIKTLMLSLFVSFNSEITAKQFLLDSLSKNNNERE